MIKVLIIEDEMPAARRLQKLLHEIDPTIEIVGHCQSIASSIAFLQTSPTVDLLLMDIKLGDGLSLEILNKVDIKTPIIFTTAYDEFTLKAFKLNSIDYLLKPVDIDELDAAIQKYNLYHHIEKAGLDIKPIIDVLTKTQLYKERFLIKQGNQLVIIMSQNIAYFYTQDSYAHLVTIDHKKYILDDSLDTLQKDLNPDQYFRINRNMIIKLESITKIEQYFNSRYKLHIQPEFAAEVIVSRERVKEFKVWAGGH